MHTIRSNRSTIVVHAAVVTLALLAMLTLWSPPSGAQAAPVTVSTRTTPEFPKAGDDVKVLVRATGCPPGNTVVETYLVSSDDTTRSTALITRDEFPSTLFFQVSAVVELPNAVEGWYGVRIVCGQYRPAQEPITNTYFRVAPASNKHFGVFGNQVQVGKTLNVTGSGCPGTSAEVGFSQSPIRAVRVNPRGTYTVNPDGTWGGALLFGGELSPGRTRVVARCLLTTPRGDQVWITYDDDVYVDVTRPS